MTNSPIQPTGQPQGQPDAARPAGDVSSKTRSGEQQPRVDGENPSFQVLLERLQAKAVELEQTSKSLEQPADLADAVADARSSLEAAGSLSERLLEAFRQVQTHSTGSDSEGSASDAPQQEDTQ